MSETVQVVKAKSNAPWILGIVGVFLTILHAACAYLCTAAAGIAAGVDDIMKGGSGDKAAQDAMTSFGAVAVVGIILMLACFVLTFFGKSKCSKVTGLILILCSVIIAILSCVHLSVPGIAAAFVYLPAGIVSIGNAKKPAA